MKLKACIGEKVVEGQELYQSIKLISSEQDIKK